MIVSILKPKGDLAAKGHTKKYNKNKRSVMSNEHKQRQLFSADDMNTLLLIM